MTTKTKEKQEVSQSEQQARAQLESIIEMVETLEKAESDKQREHAEQTIQEDALSVEVRSPWYAPGAEQEKPEEYRILLCTGGPAVQIRGRLDEYGQPESAWLQHQDWGTPWTEARTSHEERGTLIKYARCFYFGE